MNSVQRNCVRWNCIQPFLKVVNKIVQNYIIIFLNSIWWKKICKFSTIFSCKHKINKSNTNISALYWIICLYSKNICFNIFIINKSFNLFRNMFYTKRMEISNIIIMNKQSNPMSSNNGVLINIYYISPILYFSETLFLYFKIS